VTIWELKRMLLDAGVDESSYFIAGIDERDSFGKGAGMGEVVITRTEDEQEWAIRSYERGLRTRDQRYPTEDAACQAAWEMLKPRPRVIRQRSAEDRRRSAALADEAKRQYAEAEEAYRQERSARSSPDDR
jgi:hypothetical protein